MNYEKYSRKKILVIVTSVKLLLQHAALYIGRRPRLKRAAIKVLHRFPNTAARLIQTIRPGTVQPSQLQLDQSHTMRANAAHLTPLARQIYADLNAAIEHQQKVRG